MSYRLFEKDDKINNLTPEKVRQKKDNFSAGYVIAKDNVKKERVFSTTILLALFPLARSYAVSNEVYIKKKNKYHVKFRTGFLACKQYIIVYVIACVSTYFSFFFIVEY